MERKTVESSMIHSIGYDKVSKILEIQFNSGMIYKYFNVPQIEFNRMLKAESKGRYFLDCIQDSYEYARL